MHRRRPVPLVAAALAALVACSGTSPAPPPPPVASGPVDPLRNIARREGSVRVVVTLAVEEERPGVWNRREVAREQRKLVDALKPGVRVVRRTAEFPQILLAVDTAALRRLRDYPLVRTISLDETGGVNNQ